MYDGGDGEEFYSIDGENIPYILEVTTQQFILECTQNEEHLCKVLTFEFSNKIEEFTIFHGTGGSDRWIGELRFGELVTAPPDNMTSYYRFFF